MLQVMFLKETEFYKQITKANFQQMGFLRGWYWLWQDCKAVTSISDTQFRRFLWRLKGTVIYLILP